MFNSLRRRTGLVMLAGVTGLAVASLAGSPVRTAAPSKPSKAAPSAAIHGSSEWNAAPDAILYNQLNNPGPESILSQNFTDLGGVYDAYDSKAADDFVLPANTKWTIKGVRVAGVYFNGLGPATNFNVCIYQSAPTIDAWWTIDGEPVYPIPVPPGANDVHLVFNHLKIVWWTIDNIRIEGVIPPPEANDVEATWAGKEFLSASWTRDGVPIGSIQIPPGANDVEIEFEPLDVIGMQWTKDGLPIGDPVPIPPDANDLEINLFEAPLDPPKCRNNLNYTVNGGEFTIPVKPALVIPKTAPRHLWISVEANMPFAQGGEWGWTDRTVLSNSPAAWENYGPGNAFGICPTWGNMNRCLSSGGFPVTAPDFMFALAGTVN